MIWKNYSNINKKYEKKLAVEYKQVFSILQKDILSSVEGLIKSEVFSIETYVNLVFGKTKKTKTSLFHEVIKQFLKEMSIDYKESSYETELDKMLKDTKDLDRETFKTIKKEMLDLAKKIKTNNPDMNRNDLLKELQKGINAKFDLVYKQSRVNAISRTVATYSSENGKSLVAKKENFGLQWISQRNSSVRLSHRKADGQVQNDKGLFKVGGFNTPHPCGAGLPAGEIVNCRCYTKGIKNG